MKIRIRYKLRDDLEKYIDLTAQEYFDPIDEDETYENDAIPKYNDAADYLEIPTEMLEWTEIEITETNQSQNIRTQYFDEGKSWMSHRKDLDSYEEIIVMSWLNSVETHISRVHKKSDEHWQVNLVSVIKDSEDGSQSEQRIF